MPPMPACIAPSRISLTPSCGRRKRWWAIAMAIVSQTREEVETRDVSREGTGIAFDLPFAENCVGFPRARQVPPHLLRPLARAFAHKARGLSTGFRDVLPSLAWRHIREVRDGRSAPSVPCLRGRTTP